MVHATYQGGWLPLLLLLLNDTRISVKDAGYSCAPEDSLLVFFLGLGKAERLLACSALAVLASSSGVSSERTAFMDLVKTEIDRLNESIGKSGSVTMIFQRGNIRVRSYSLLAGSTTRFSHELQLSGSTFKNVTQCT